MWLSYWDLNFDPFRPGAVGYLPTPTAEEAVARLVHQVEAGARRAELRGIAGLGKSAAVDEALRRLRGPSRAVVTVRRPADGEVLLRSLVEAIGPGRSSWSGRSDAFRRLLDGARLLGATGRGLVVAVDDDALLDAPEDARLLDRIEAIGAQSRARFGLIVAGRGPSTAADPWGLAVRLDRLTRGEASAYLAGKLAAAGREAPAFSERAIARLHAVAGGLPRALDRLAGLAMRIGAVERRAMIEAEVIEGVARECLCADAPIVPIGGRTC